MYKHIFSGSLSIDDAIFLRNKCPKEDLYIIDSIIRSQNLQSHISYTQLNVIINTLTKLKYKEECTKYLDELNIIKKYNNCTQQDKTGYIDAITDVITKIISMKQTDDSYVDLPKIEKECPHCGKMNKAPLGTKYIVCGIDTMGILPIDNVGNSCLNDWCFSCGKKLCKNWYEHKLYEEENRTHNNVCCKQHAIKHNNNYPNDYCQCNQYQPIHF